MLVKYHSVFVVQKILIRLLHLPFEVGLRNTVKVDHQDVGTIAGVSVFVLFFFLFLFVVTADVIDVVVVVVVFALAVVAVTCFLWFHKHMVVFLPGFTLSVRKHNFNVLLSETIVDKMLINPHPIFRKNSPLYIQLNRGGYLGFPIMYSRDKVQQNLFHTSKLYSQNLLFDETEFLFLARVNLFAFVYVR